MNQMQKAKMTQAFDQDLKEAISDVKKGEYWRKLETVHDPVALDAMEHEIVIDSQLARNDRLQLLAEVERATALAG
jgi:hypothetical protein